MFSNFKIKMFQIIHGGIEVTEIENELCNSQTSDTLIVVKIRQVTLKT